MFIQIIALLSIFQLIFAVESTNLLLTGSENLSEKSISDDVAIKNIQERFELLQTMNENVRAKMTSLSVYFNEHLTKQKKEIKEDLEELKAALIGTKKLSDSEKTEDSNTMYRSRDLRNENSETNHTCQILPTNCAEAFKETGRYGIHKIKVPGSKQKPFYVPCLGDGSDNTDPWTLIHRRVDGKINFFLKYAEYQHGFGNLEREFFIGLDNLHAITKSAIHELWIEMEDFEGEKRSAKYSTFSIGDGSQNYILHVLGNYSGDAGDSLTYHAGEEWSTKDVDNDSSKGRDCASTYSGAWWYNDCLNSNLNGRYLKGKLNKKDKGEGVVWEAWHGQDYSLKYVHMAIRPITD